MRVRLKKRCKCGCTKLTTWNRDKKNYNIYQHGHNWKGKNHTKESKDKIRIANTGTKASLETLRKMSIVQKGKKASKKTKLKMSLSQKGKHTGWNQTDEAKDRMSIVGRGRIPWNKGKKGLYSKETLKKMGIWQKGLKIGNNNPAWLGGKSFEDYGIEFNRNLKLQIRKRDNYTCQKCNIQELLLDEKLTIHHIDYDKKNNKPENLISLCRSCHGKTCFNRGFWIGYLIGRLKKVDAFQKR